MESLTPVKQQPPPPPPPQQDAGAKSPLPQSSSLTPSRQTTPSRKTRSKSTPSRKATPLVENPSVSIGASGAGALVPSNMSNSDVNSGEGILVAIRMRPLNKNESTHSRVWKALPKFTSVTQTTVEGKPLPERILHRNFFTFDKTFGEEASTEAVYTSVAKNIVKSACTGLNGTIFAYGQTSSGKTFTMQGSGTIAEGASAELGGGGIVHMAAQEIFSHIENTPDRSFTVRASFLEIYNEDVRDLLVGDSRTLQIREDPRRGVFVQAKEEVVTDFSTLLAILFQGDKSRAFAATAMNERSSRSHTIFRITIESRAKHVAGDTDMAVDSGAGGAAVAADADDGAVLVSTLNLVDLAGSESVRHTGATGDRQKEGGMINQSLLTLSRVMKSLGTPNQAHINFRDSKLTRILQPSLSGNARMAVICCITPSELYLEETRSTLQFAQRAKLVKTNAKVNEVLDDRTIIRRLQRELTEARRLGSGPEVLEHIQLLERRAVAAEQEASRAKDKLRQVYESTFQFSGSGETGTEREKRDDNTVEPSEHARPTKRARRLSEGAIAAMVSADTPKALERGGGRFPSTLPRAKQTTLFPETETLSDLSQVDFLRRSLAVKSVDMADLNEQFDLVSAQLKTTQEELAASTAAHLSLQGDHDTMTELAARQGEEIAQLKVRLEEAATEHSAVILLKDTELQNFSTTLDQQRDEYKALEGRMHLLQQESHAREVEASSQLEGKEDVIESLELQIQIEEAFFEHLLGSESKLKAVTASQLQSMKDAESSHEQLRKQLEHEVADKVGEIDALKLELESRRSEIERGCARAEALSQEMATARADNETVTGQLKAMQESLQEKESQLDALEKEQVEMSNKVQSTVAENSEIRADLLLANNEITEKSTTIQESEIAMEALNRAKDEVCQNLEKATADIVELSNQRDAMHQESISLKRQLDESSSAITAKDSEYSSLKQELESHLAEIDRLRDQLETTTTAMNKIDSEKDLAMERLSGMEVDLQAALSALNELKQTRDDLNGNVQSLEADNGDLRAQIQAAGEEIASLRQSVEDKDDAIRSLHESNDDVASHLVKVKAEVAELTSANEAMREESSTLNKLYDECKQNVADKETELNALEQELQSKAADVEQLQIAVERTTTDIEQATADKNTALNRANELEDELKASAADLSALQQVRDELNVKLEAAEKSGCDLQTRLLAETIALADSNVRLEECQTTIETLHTKIDDLNHAVEKSKSDLASLSSHVEAAKEATTSVRSERDDVQSKLLELQCNLNECQADLVALRSELNVEKQRNASIQSILDQTLDGKLQLEQELSNLANKITADDGTISGLKEDICGLESHVCILKEEIGRLERKRVAFEEAALRQAEEHQRLEASLEAAVESLERAEAKYSTLSLAHSELQTSELEKGNTIGNLQLQIQNYEQMACSTALDLEKAKTSLDVAQTKADGLLVVLSQTLIQEDDLAERSVEQGSLALQATNLTEQYRRILGGLLVVLQQPESDYVHIEFQTLRDQNAICSDALVRELVDSFEEFFKKQLESRKELVTMSSALLAAEIKFQGMIVVSNRATEQHATTFDDLQATLLKLHHQSELLVSSQQVAAGLASANSALENRCSLLESESASHNREKDAVVRERDEEIKLLEASIGRLEEEHQAYVLMHDTFAQATTTSERQMERLIDRMVDFERTTLDSPNTPSEDSASNTLSEKIADALGRLESVATHWAAMKARFADESRELRNCRDELLSMHDADEAANDQINSLRQQLNDLKDELDSKDSILSTMDKERQQLLSSLEETRGRLEGIDESAAGQTEELRKANADLQLLLVNSNKTIDETRGQASRAEFQVEEMKQMLLNSNKRISTLERMNDELSTKSIMRASSRSSDELNRVLTEKQALERVLDEERSSWSRAEADMKRQMSINERELIQDAEKSMRELRADLASKVQLTKTLEAEAYEARMKNETLDDECKRARDRIAEYESKASNLESENARLRRSCNRLDSEKDSEISSLRASLQQAKASQQKAQVSLNDIESKLASAIRAKESSEQKLAAINLEGMEKENLRLTTEVDTLRSEAFEQQKTIQAHEARIKKLQDNRLTKSQLAAIQKLKSDNTAFVSEVQQLKSDNESMRAEIAALRSTAGANQMEGADLTKLRFDNGALEKQLRKVAAHCQSLEDDRVRVLRVLQTAKNVVDVDQNDIEKAIVTICDKLSSLERDNGALSGVESRATIEANNLRAQITSLNRQLIESRELSSRAARTEDEYRAQLGSLKNQLQEQHRFATRTRELETENVELHDDLKAIKHQLYGSKAEVTKLKAEINLLRDEISMKRDLRPDAAFLDTVAPRQRHDKSTLDEMPLIGSHSAATKLTPKKVKDTAMTSKQTPLSTKYTPKTKGTASKHTPREKENSASNNLPPRSSVSKAVVAAAAPPNLSATRASRQAAKLNEVYGAAEDNTQDCRQS